MLFDVTKQLNALTQTLRLVSNVTLPIEPGQTVKLQVASAAPDLFVTDKVLDNPILAGAAQLLTQIPVEIQVKWSVSDGERTLEPGQDFLATNGMAGPSVDFIFKPEFMELGTVTGLVDDSLRIITARVTLRAWPNNVAPTAPPTTEPQAVVSKEVKMNLFLGLAPLEIPVMLALFRHTNFRALDEDSSPGFVLIVVPEGSYLQDLTEMMNDQLQKIEEALRPIRSLIGLAAFLTRLNILRHALLGQPMLRLAHGNLKNIDKIHMRKETFLGIDILDRDLRPEDRASSLIFISPPGRRRVECFVRRDHIAEEGFIPNPLGGPPIKVAGGVFSVRTGLEMITMIPDLHNVAGIAGVEVVVPGGFHDSISSVKFRR